MENGEISLVKDENTDDMMEVDFRQPKSDCICIETNVLYVMKRAFKMETNMEYL